MWISWKFFLWFSSCGTRTDISKLRDPFQKRQKCSCMGSNSLLKSVSRILCSLQYESSGRGHDSEMYWALALLRRDEFRDVGRTILCVIYLHWEENPFTVLQCRVLSPVMWRPIVWYETKKKQGSRWNWGWALNSRNNARVFGLHSNLMRRKREVGGLVRWEES